MNQFKNKKLQINKNHKKKQKARRVKTTTSDKAEIEKDFKMSKSDDANELYFN